VACALALTTAGAARVHAQDQPIRESDMVAHDARGHIVQQPNRTGFGEKGQWTFSIDNAIQFSRRTQTGSPAVTNLTFLPATDYFVIKNLSIGGFIGDTYTKAGDTHANTFTIGPRIGYNIPFSHLFSLWPKIGVSYAHTKNRDGDTVKNNAAALNVYVPVMLHPAEHFFFGFGPFVDTDLNGNHKATTWGFKLTLGGWI
jgi:hypothetical protein